MKRNSYIGIGAAAGFLAVLVMQRIGMAGGLAIILGGLALASMPTPEHGVNPARVGLLIVAVMGALFLMVYLLSRTGQWGLTLAVLFMAAAAPLVLWDAYRRRRVRSRIENGCCPKCGYDLRASPEKCPECGQEIPSHHRWYISRMTAPDHADEQ